jgi:hypothetical protein
MTKNVYLDYPRASKVINLISQGLTITNACMQEGITLHAFRKAVNNNEDLQELLEEAEQMSHDAMADLLLTMDRVDSGNPYAQSDPKMVNAISSNIKWYLEKKNPKKFGNRVSVDHTITADKAIIAALTEGRQRALEAANGSYVVDAVFEEIKS